MSRIGWVFAVCRRRAAVMAAKVGVVAVDAYEKGRGVFVVVRTWNMGVDVGCPLATSSTACTC